MPRISPKKYATATSEMKLILSLLAVWPCLTVSTALPPADFLLYVGTFTKARGQGIYAFRLSSSTGKLTPLGLAARTINPSFLAVHPNGRILYAVVNQENGEIGAFTIDSATGMLTLLNRVSSRGTGPCFVALTNSARLLLAANYTSGSAAVFPVEEDGRLGEATGFAQHSGSSVNRERQEGPHTHSINPSPDERYAFAADLGVDKLFVYRLQEGKLIAGDPVAVKTVPGAGPRHFTFDPAGRHAYLVNELDSTIMAFAYDAVHGRLREIQSISAIPATFSATNYSADIHVHPSGKFLYASDRGLDSIAVFTIDAASGKLSSVEYVPTGGQTPRNFTLDPTGRFLVVGNEDSDNIVVFRIDPKTGRLTPTGEQAAVPSPACLKLVPER